MFKIIIPVLLATLLLSACSKKKETLAIVGNQKLSVEEYVQRIENAPPAYRKYLSSPQGQKQFMDLIIREKVVMSEAKKAGIGGTKEFKDNLSSFEREIKKRLADFKENLLMELYLKKLHEQELNPTDADIKNYYEKNKNDFKKPVEMSVSHILLLDEKTANEVYGKLKAGESFEKLAAAHSIDPTSAQRGGTLGSVRKGELAPELESAALNLRLGAYSGVVKSDFGYHIIKKNSEKLLPEITFDDAQELIRRLIMKNKFDSWVKGVLAKSRVDVKKDVLERITKDYLGDLSEK